MATHAAGFAGALSPGDRPVVLAIDMMEAYFRAGSVFCLLSRDCLESAARVIAAARTAGVPVIHTRVEFAADGADGGVFLQKVPALRALAGGGELSQLMPRWRQSMTSSCWSSSTRAPSSVRRSCRR